MQIIVASLFWETETFRNSQQKALVHCALHFKFYKGYFEIYVFYLHIMHLILLFFLQRHIEQLSKLVDDEGSKK